MPVLSCCASETFLRNFLWAFSFILLSRMPDACASAPCDAALQELYLFFRRGTVHVSAWVVTAVRLSSM